MHTLHIAATTVAFALILLQWQKTRETEDFGIRANWPLIVFSIALLLSLPSSFLSLFENYEEIRLVTSELNRLSGVSLGLSFVALCFSVSTCRTFDIGVLLFVLLFGGCVFFCFTTNMLTQKLKERSPAPASAPALAPSNLNEG